MSQDKMCPKCSKKLKAHQTVFALPTHVHSKLGADVGKPSINVHSAIPIAVYQCQNSDCGYLELYSVA